MPTIRYINKFPGYSNFQDITNMPINMLAAGSQNVFINDGEKIEPRAGMKYFGAEGTPGNQTDIYWTLAHRMHSKYDDFVNKQGIKIPLRFFYEGHTSIGDIMEAWLPEYIAGVAQTTKKWYQVTASNPSLPLVSTHRYFFGEWFDQILNSIGVPDTTSPQQPELIFTYGAKKIGNWSGGFTPVVSITPTTITTLAGVAWTTQGFIGTPEGDNIIVVNGVEYIVTGGFGTDTVTVASTTGINVNDIAFQNIYFNDTLSGKTTYDVCDVINNQIYYIDWNQRNVYTSWNRNQIASLSTTIFSGVGLDDGVFGGTYTGSTRATFKVQIDSALPGINQQSFTEGTPYSLNDATYNTGGYTGAAGIENKYIVTVVANFTLHAPGSGYAFIPGETVVGSISGATAMYFAEAVANPSGTFSLHGVRVLTGDFVVGDVVTGLSSGAVITLDDVYFNDWIQFFKNGVAQTISYSIWNQITFPLQDLVLTATLTDGLSITFTNFFGHGIGDSWLLDIREKAIDTFQWYKNDVLQAGHINITGGAQALSDGITITFGSSYGHTLGDLWTVIATQKIVRGWSEFSYDNPNRLPGQGYTVLLDSNGWTMKPQEHTMIVNAQAGHFYDITLTLSSNLLSEAVSLVRLKSEPQNKVLFPYLIRYVQNQLSTISLDKVFNILGRQKFLELQQIKTLSDVVRIDFNTVNWEDADILYYKRKIYFNIPRTTEAGIGACIFVYDEYRKYWHPPQIFGKRISLLSIIDDKLIGHSYEQNESYELFVGLNDLDKFPIATQMVFPYDSTGNRYNEKATSAIGFEGYILGNPEINWLINFGVGGCEGQQKGIIAPQNTKKGLCIPVDRASLGKSNLGFHGLGNDPVEITPHFFYIKNFDNQPYYQRNIELSCVSKEQRWSIISLGTSLDNNNTNNITIVDPN